VFQYFRQLLPGSSNMLLFCLVVLAFIGPKLGTNKSSALQMSCFVIGHFGIMLPFTYLIKSSALGLPKNYILYGPELSEVAYVGWPENTF